MYERTSRISCKGLSETPLHFIFRYKGDSVGRYRGYPLLHPELDEQTTQIYCTERGKYAIVEERHREWTI